MALHVRMTHQERTLRKDWLVVDGNWRRAGAEEIPCEQVREQRFLGLGVPAKQLDPRGREWELRERESGMGWGRLREQGQCQKCTQSGSWHQNVRKNAAHKAHEKSLTSKSLNPGWLGKGGTEQTLGQAWLLQKGEVKEVSTCVVVSGDVGLS
jgi:hypothetical protein